MEINDYLNILIKKQGLNKNQAKDLVNLLTHESSSPVLISSVLTALASKGETVDEIVGFTEGMKGLMLGIKTPNNAIDIVGTGGDGSGSINISTVSAIVTAACGVPVAKHGNRAASSKCGSADVLETLGMNINLTPEKAERVLGKTGMVFLFAPVFHPAMKTVGPVRKELKIRTIFNYLGPFLNPGKVKRMLLGAANLELAKKFLEIAKKLNFNHLIIVNSNDGMDEISIADKTTAFELKEGKIKKFVIDPKKLGFAKYSKTELVGGDANLNAKITRDILEGKEMGAKKDAIILNSGFALMVAGKIDNINQGMKMAKEAIESGQALKVLKSLRKETKS